MTWVRLSIAEINERIPTRNKIPPNYTGLNKNQVDKETAVSREYLYLFTKKIAVRHNMIWLDMKIVITTIRKTVIPKIDITIKNFLNIVLALK